MITEVVTVPAGGPPGGPVGGGPAGGRHSRGGHGAAAAWRPGQSRPPAGAHRGTVVVPRLTLLRLLPVNFVHRARRAYYCNHLQTTKGLYHGTWQGRTDTDCLLHSLAPLT